MRARDWRARDCWTRPRPELHNTRHAEPNLARHFVVVEPCLENQLAQTTGSKTGGVLQSCHTWDNGGSSSHGSCEEFVLSASGFYSTHLWPRGSNHIITRCNGGFSRCPKRAGTRVEAARGQGFVAVAESVVLQEGARSVSHLQAFAENFASTCREFHDRPDWLGFLALLRSTGRSLPHADTELERGIGAVCGESVAQ